MRKLLRFMLISFVLISILFLSSCRYKMFWDKKDIEIGSIENYVISEDKNGEYYISAFTNKGIENSVIKTIKLYKTVLY